MASLYSHGHYIPREKESINFYDRNKSSLVFSGEQSISQNNL